MAHKIVCDVCGKELTKKIGIIHVSYSQEGRTDGIPLHFEIDNHFDFCCVEHLIEYVENVGLEKGIE